MDTDRFDCLVRALAVAATRRRLLRHFSSLPLPVAFTILLAKTSDASKRRRHTTQQGRAEHREWLQVQRKSKKKRKKKRKCAKAGQTTSKKRKKCCRGLVKDGSGRCAQPASDCSGGCAGNSVCHAGVCRPCTVTCLSGIPEICGEELQLALNEGGTVYVCPGRYRGNFTIATAVIVIGAGEGAAAPSNTILDGPGGQRVVRINSGVGLVALEQLSLTGSIMGNGGISHQGTMLRMTACTVSGNSTTLNGSGGGISVSTGRTLEMRRCTVRDNHATGTGGVGGGISTGGTTTLTDCLVEANSAGDRGGGLHLGGGTTTLLGSTEVRGNQADEGGGIFVGSGSLVIAETCHVSENMATAGKGGGILNREEAGPVTLEGTDPSSIVVNNCHENCVGTVPKCAAEPVSCPP